MQDVQVIEEHDEALWYIKKLYEKDLRKITLVHVDTHSDMALKEFFDLGSFILKAVYLGYINEVLWVKHSFCREFDEGEYKFSVGNNDEGDLLCSLNHPVFRKTYSPLDGITENEKEVIFKVFNVDNLDAVYLSGQDNRVIFDLDLDFFGANNILEQPLRQSIGNDEYFSLRQKITSGYGSIEKIEEIEKEYLKCGKAGVVKFANIFAGGLVFPQFKLDHEDVKEALGNLKKLLTKINPEYIIMCKSKSSGYLNVENPEIFAAKIENFLKLWKN